MPERPLLVRFLIAVFAIAGLLNIIAGALIWSSSSLLSAYKWITTSAVVLTSMIAVIVGLFQIVTAMAIWERESYASTLAIIFSLIGLFSFPLGTILSVIAIVLLFSKEVRAYLT